MLNRREFIKSSAIVLGSTGAISVIKATTSPPKIHRRKVAIGYHESLHYDGKFPALNMAGFEWSTNSDNKILLSSVNNQFLRKYVLRVLQKQTPDSQMIDTIDFFWGIIIKNERKCCREYVRMRKLSGYEHAEGWIERERADDIERFIHGNRDTAYSQISPQLLQQIQRIEKARKARA